MFPNQDFHSGICTVDHPTSCSQWLVDAANFSSFATDHLMEFMILLMNSSSSSHPYSFNPLQISCTNQSPAAKILRFVCDIISPQNSAFLFTMASTLFEVTAAGFSEMLSLSAWLESKGAWL
jgi:hypothetical protein